FNGLVLYMILFPCFKALIHLMNLCNLRTQLDSQKMQTVEFISEYDYVAYIKTPLRRIQFLFLLYPLVILAHVAIAFICYYLRDHRL
ncbi:MAG: hypothetical protein O9353_06740, partial [Bacteroidia bacterium]|nr:hypothetical protein [Bacteroidia bacterium]